MKNKKYIIIGIISFIVFASSVSLFYLKNKESDIKNYSSYNSEKYGYQFMYPPMAKIVAGEDAKKESNILGQYYTAPESTFIVFPEDKSPDIFRASRSDKTVIHIYKDENKYYSKDGSVVSGLKYMYPNSFVFQDGKEISGNGSKMKTRICPTFILTNNGTYVIGIIGYSDPFRSSIESMGSDVPEISDAEKKYAAEYSVYIQNIISSFEIIK